jgi:two-component system NtrC family sensor kinase
LQRFLSLSQLEPESKSLMKKVLIIDDDTAARQTTVGELRRSGYEVFEAADGGNCMEAARHRLSDLVLEAAANGIVITNRYGHIVWVNPAFTRLTGYSADDVAGKTPSLLKSGRHGQAFYEKLWNTILNGNVWEGELINRRKDGSLYHEEMTITPVLDDQGRIQNFIAIKQDISRRKRDEEELRAREESFRALVDNVPDYIYFKDADSRFTRINLALARHLGLANTAEAVGKSDADFYPRREARQKLVDEQRLLATGEPILGLVEQSDTVSEAKWVSSTKVPIYGVDGSITGLMGISRDVTGIKTTEAELRWKTAFLEAQVNSSSDGVLVVDDNGKIILQNQRMTELFKIPRHLADDSAAETQRQWIADMTTNPAQFIKKVLDLYSQPNEISHDELELKDGTILDLYSSPVIDKDGKYYGRIWTFRDITKRRRTELERQRMEIQLRQAQKLEAIGQLAAGIAHEINTPTQYVGDNTRFLKEAFESIVTVLRSHGELFAAARQNAVTPELLDRAEETLAAGDLDYLFEQIPSAIAETLDGVERVTKIVRAMKEFSHPGGREKSPADLNKAVESTATVARNEWKYVADLNLDLAADLPFVPCFLGEFNQSVLNLIVNAAHAIGDAVKDNPGTKGLITVSTRHDGDFVEVRVADTGTGIPEAHRAHIFEPFFTTKDVGRGTGQGLALVYNTVVKRHGGTARFETETGKGTTFILRLPVNPAIVPAEPPAGQPASDA